MTFGAYDANMRYIRITARRGRLTIECEREGWRATCPITAAEQAALEQAAEFARRGHVRVECRRPVPHVEFWRPVDVIGLAWMIYRSRA